MTAPPNNTAPDQQQPPPAQSPPPPTDTTSIDDGAADRLVAAGMAREDAERMVDNVNRLIAVGIPRDAAIRTVGSPSGRIGQGIGATLTGLIQGLGIPFIDVARVNNQVRPDIYPGIWPGISDSAPATVAPDLPAPVSSALGVAGGLGGMVAKFAVLGKALSAVPGLTSAAGRFISALLDRIPVPAAAAIARDIRGTGISSLPGEAAPAATAARTAAGAAAGAGKAARVLSDAERRRLLLQEIEKAVAAANERATAGSPVPPTPRP